MGKVDDYTVGRSQLRKGDTIKCADADDCIRTMNELASCGIETDFLYEKDGESGLWLKVIKVNTNGL